MLLLDGAPNRGGLALSADVVVFGVEDEGGPNENAVLPDAPAAVFSFGRCLSSFLPSCAGAAEGVPNENPVLPAEAALLLSLALDLLSVAGTLNVTAAGVTGAGEEDLDSSLACRLLSFNLLSNSSSRFLLLAESNILGLIEGELLPLD